MTIVACREPECERPVAALGMCNMHYTRDKKRRNPCSYPGCGNGRAFVATGYCQTHQRRLEKHGDPSITMKGKAHKVQRTPGGLRICKACGEAKQDSEYHRDRCAPDGLVSKCKPCACAYEAERYERDAEKVRAKQRARRAADPDKARRQDMERYKRMRDERIERATMQSHIRRARLAEVPTDKGLTRLALRKRDGDLCHYCKREMDFSRAVGRKFHDLHATIEHVIAISQGGSHTFENCVLACRSCNLRKNAKTVEEFTGSVPVSISASPRWSQAALFDLAS